MFGFSSQMSTSFAFPSPWEGCYLLMKFTVPAGAYVDPYELKSISAKSQANVTFSIGSVSVEHMEQQSESFNFHLLSKLACQPECIFLQSVPLHARYHLASYHNNATDSWAVVKVNPPDIFKSCLTDSKEPCFNERGDGLCEWQPVPPFEFATEGTALQVPVGDMNIQFLVTVVTISITLLATIKVNLIH